MPLKRDRPKLVRVNSIVAVSLSAAALLQIGDVKTVMPYSRAKSFSSERGAVSFVGGAIARFSESNLHFVNQRDQDQRDMQILLGRLGEPWRRTANGKKKTRPQSAQS